MKRINLKLVSSFVMLSIIVLQVLAPTVYSASEIFAGFDAKLATINDFSEQDGSLVLDLNASEEVSISFDYELLSDTLTYDVSLNDNDLDVTSVASLETGINELVITEENQDYTQIDSFDVIATRSETDLVEVVQTEDASEVASETTSEVASETTSEVASETTSEVASETTSEVASETTSEATEVHKTKNSVMATQPSNWQDPADTFVYEDDLFTTYETMYGDEANFDFGKSINKGL